MNVRQAIKVTGGLSKPSKMPGRSFSIPAELCKLGSILRQKKNSVCSACYALKGCYVFPVVKNKLQERFNKLGHKLWVKAMACLVNSQSKDFFRWHDAGDIQSIQHLGRIVAVCKLTPNTKHWLPTREARIVSDYQNAGGVIPANLCIRISGQFIGQIPVSNLPISTVDANSVVPKTVQCPATEIIGYHKNNKPIHKNDGACGNCRACWSTKVKWVNYVKH